MSVIETELTPAAKDLVISNGETSSSLSIQMVDGEANYVTVESGGVLMDSLVKDGSILLVDPGATIQNIAATDESTLLCIGGDTKAEVIPTAFASGLIVENGAAFTIDKGGYVSGAQILTNGNGAVNPGQSAAEVAVTGGSYTVAGGSATVTSVGSNGAFTVQNAQAGEVVFSGLAQSTTILDGGFMEVIGAAAQDTAMNGGGMVVSGGSAFKTVVSAGSFTVRNSQGKVDKTDVVFSGFAQSTTVFEGGRMEVLDGALVQDTVVSGGEFVVSSGSASNTTVAGGAMTVLVGNTVEKTTMTGGTVIVSGYASDTTVNGGEFRAKDTNISGMTVNAGGTAVLEGCLLAGKSVFAEGASITVDGTIWFDTQYATATDAQIKGAFAAGAAGIEYMLTADPNPGVYLLADNIPSFSGGVLLDYGTGYTLNLGEPVIVKDGEGNEYAYSLNLKDGKALELTIAEYAPDAALIYVNSKWTGESGTTVDVNGITATIGVNAFANGDDAVDAAEKIEGAKIRVTGGDVSFSKPISIDTAVYGGATLISADESVTTVTGTLTVNSGATLAGKAVFAEGANITINGTVLFDTKYVTKDDITSVQCVANTLPGGKATFTLNVTAPEIGVYHLLAGISEFGDEVIFGEKTLTVGGGAVTDGAFDYTLVLAGEKSDILALSVTEHDGSDTTPPTITVTASETEPTCRNVVVTAVFSDDSGAVPDQRYTLVKEGEAPGDVKTWSEYPFGGVTVTENNSTVYFWATDAAGNTASENYKVTNIDRSLDDEPPTITVSADTTELAAQVVLTAMFSDNSGYVPFRQYKFGEAGEWTDYPAEGGVVVTDNITVYFQAKDGAGNTGYEQYKVTNVDKPDTEAPVCISITATPATATNQNVLVKATFTDNVDENPVVKYRLGETGSWELSPADGVLMTDNGTVYFMATDAAGNDSGENPFVVDFIDRIPPEKPSASADTTATTDQPVTVTAVFSDDSVRKEYSVDGGDWLEYPEGGVTVSENCVISFRGTDAAGNLSEETKYTVSNISHDPADDKTPPTLVYVKANITKPTNRDVTVKASFTDNVGVTSVKYRINDSDIWIDYSPSGVLVADNNTAVYFQAFDAAGNMSEIAGYTVTNIDKSLPDGQEKVFVNPEWALLGSGTVVDTFNGDHATVGVNAFGTADEANAAVDADGQIHLDSGTLSFSDAACNIVIHQAALVADNEAGLDNVSILNNGSISMTKGVMTDCKVLDGRLTVESGAIVDGLKHDSPYDNINVAVNGATVKNVVMGCQMSVLDMDYTCSMSVAGEGGLAQNVEVVKGGHLIVSSGGRAENVDLSGDMENYLEGELYVSEGGKASGVTVSSGGYVACWRDASVDDFVILSGGQAYLYGFGSKAVVSGGVLGVQAGGVMSGATVAAGGSMYTVSSAGIGTALDTEIQFGGIVSNQGHASNTVIRDGGTMSCVYGVAEETEVQSGGRLELHNGTLREVTVRNGGTLAPAEEAYGGTLTGHVTIEEGATVSLTANQTIDFDISDLDGTETTALVSGFSFIGGAPGLTLTFAAEQVSGTYLLADGVTDFGEDRGIAFGDYTLTVGETVKAGVFSFTLNHVDEMLVLTVDSPFEPGPDVPPSMLYVNAAWLGQTGEVTFVDASGATVTATIGVDAFVTGDEAAVKAGAVVNPVIEVVGGEVSFSATVNASVVIDEGATLVGRASFADGVTITVNGAVAFDTAFATATEPQFTGFAAEGDGISTLTVGEGVAGAGASVLFATGADSAIFGSRIAYGGFVYTLGGADFFVDENDLSYVLDVTAQKELVLSFVDLVNGPDNHNNDWLYDKKQGISPFVGTFAVSLLADGVSNVAVDTRGSVRNEVPSLGRRFYNFVSKDDPADFAKIVLDSPARLSFSVEAEDAAKFIVYCLETGEDKNGDPTYKLKALQTTTLKKNKTTGLYAATTKNLLIDLPAEGENKEYFVAMQSANKKSEETYYNVNLNWDAEAKDSTLFYSDGDDGWNDWLYNSKDKENPLNPAVCCDVPFAIDGETTSVLVDKPASVRTEVSGIVWNNFVGFGDAADYKKFACDDPARLSFNVTAAGAAKFIVYCLETGEDKNGDPTYKLKALQTTTLKKDKTTGLYAATTKNLLLDMPADDDREYFISVQSTGAKKGDAVYYNVALNKDTEAKDSTLFYSDADDGTNNWLYDKKDKENPVNQDVMDADPVMIRDDVNEISLETDEDAVSHTDEQRHVVYKNYVGFGDNADYAKIGFADGTSMSFHIEATGAAKFTLYSFRTGTDKKGNETYTMKALQTLSLKKVKDDNNVVYYAGDTKALTLAAEEGTSFFVAMESTNAKKGDAVYYKVNLNHILAQDSSALAMPESAAGAALSGDKQSWQDLVSLA